MPRPLRLSPTRSIRSPRALAITSAGSLTNQTMQTITGTIESADAGLTVSIYDGSTLIWAR